MKVGIIDVGGGMKGAFSSGLYDYLMDQNIMITKGYGVSAGAANLVTYLSGQRGRTLRFYTIYPKRKEYMGISQFLKTGSFFNLKYVYRTLSYTGGEDAFDFDAYKSSEMEMEFVATNALTGKPVYFPKDSIRTNDMLSLEASATLPVLNRPTVIDGIPYFDGGLSDPIPYEKAFEEGMDRVVVVLTRNRYLERRAKKDRFPAFLLNFTYPEAARALKSRAELYNSQIRGMECYERNGRLLCVYPEDTDGVTTTRFEEEDILKLYQRGYDKGSEVAAFIKGK